MENGAFGKVCRFGETESRRKIMVEEYVASFLQEIVKNIKEPQLIVFFGDGYECRGLGYEQLAANGPAGTGVSHRYFRCRMDGYRSRGGYICQLAGSVQATAPLYGGSEEFHHPARLFLQPLRR